MAALSISIKPTTRVFEMKVSEPTTTYCFYDYDCDFDYVYV